MATDPADLLVLIGPCIRPPLFEVDIAAMIQRDAIAAGVPASQVQDSGTCTGKFGGPILFLPGGKRLHRAAARFVGDDLLKSGLPSRSPLHYIQKR